MTQLETATSLPCSIYRLTIVRSVHFVLYLLPPLKRVAAACLSYDVSCLVVILITRICLSHFGVRMISTESTAEDVCCLFEHLF